MFARLFKRGARTQRFSRRSFLNRRSFPTQHPQKRRRKSGTGVFGRRILASTFERVPELTEVGSGNGFFNPEGFWFVAGMAIGAEEDIHQRR